MTETRTIRAPRGTERSCKSWAAEGALRMLMNNLDPEVAEIPEQLVVYGGRGQAARSWEAFDAIVRELQNLEPDQTLLVQSGKPVGVIQTHEDAPRVMIANSNLVPHWATQSHFDDLADRGLMMYGQMTAGSWIYIGTQGILQGTFETFAECARQHFGGTLKGTLNVTAGCGGMGGAQPLAITLNDGTALIADCCQERWTNVCTTGTSTKSSKASTPPSTGRSKQKHKAKRSALAGAAPRWPCWNDWKRGIVPETLTDQTVHDPLWGYYPEGMSRPMRTNFATAIPSNTSNSAPMRCDDTWNSCCRCNDLDPRSLTTATTSVNAHLMLAVVMRLPSRASSPHTSVLSSAEARPLPLGRLVGRPQRHQSHDQALLELFPEDESLRRWLEAAEERVPSKDSRLEFVGSVSASETRRKTVQSIGGRRQSLRPHRHWPRSP